MPYKLHLENREPTQGIEIAGKVIGAHIVPETPPLLTVETKQEAKQPMLQLIAQGIRPGDLYAVGYDWLPAEPA